LQHFCFADRRVTHLCNTAGELGYATTDKFGFDLKTVDIKKHLNTRVINILLSMIIVLTLMLVERYVSTNLRKPGRNQLTR